MIKDQITKLSKKKEQTLLKMYFGDLIKEAVIKCPGTIEEYMKDLPLKIEAEDVTFLKEFRGIPLLEV